MILVIRFLINNYFITVLALIFNRPLISVHGHWHSVSTRTVPTQCQYGLGCYRTQQISVVVVHTHTLPFFPHPHPHSDTMKMCCSNDYLILKNYKKIWNLFFKIFFSFFFEVVIIWTVHLDVRKLCGCGRFWGYCGVCGQQPQQQLLSAHCCGAVTA